MIFRTLNARLVFFYTFASSLLFVLFAFLIYFEYQKELMETVDRNLLEIAQMESYAGPTRYPDSRVELIRNIEGKYYKVVPYQGGATMLLLDSDKEWPLNRQLMMTAFQGKRQFETAGYNDKKYRNLYFPVSTEKIILIRKSQENIDGKLAGLKRLFFLSFFFWLATSALIGTFLARKMLFPIAKIKAFAEETGQGKWDQRIDLEGKEKEIHDLGESLNNMIDGIRRSIESQKRFVSDVSHEIRSPLTSLRGSIEVALRKKRDSDEYEDVLRSGLSDVVRLSRIIDNLLFLSRTDDNILSLRRQWFEVRRLLETAVEGFKYKAEAGGLSVIEEYQPDIELNGDIDLLQQAFSNIIDNAVKYTPQGGKIMIKTQEEDSVIKIMISDTGIGIPEEEIPHIFERFYRVDTGRSRRSGGTGLGLAIANRIVKAHNGEIFVSSTVGKGSEFTVILPQKPD